VDQKDSPVLEFSFRNIWQVLSTDARAILAVMTIFDGPLAVQQLCVATEWNVDRIEKALTELADVTLVTRNTHIADGRVVYAALPITLSFARHQLAGMDTFETECRRRFQRFSEQMQLQDAEIYRFKSVFTKYGLQNENEKRAVILCRRGESEMFGGNVLNAGGLFRQAREMAPNSAYVLAMSASYELARNHVGTALDYAKEACKRCNKLTGALCFTILARVLDVQRDRAGRVDALKKALQYEPGDNIVRHQYGLALSRVGRSQEAVDEFTRIITDESAKAPVHQTLLYALKTRIITYRRCGRNEEAEDDLSRAKEIIAQNPHLQHEGRHFLDLEGENDSGIWRPKK
jgi:tetratricopeptide (TPR) repeat protein